MPSRVPSRSPTTATPTAKPSSNPSSAPSRTPSAPPTQKSIPTTRPTSVPSTYPTSPHSSAPSTSQRPTTARYGHIGSLFKDYVAKYGLTFASSDDYNTALGVFADNLNIITQYNANPANGKAIFGINSLTHLSASDVMAKKGYVPPSGAALAKIRMAHLSPESRMIEEATSVANIKVDWTGTFTTPIKDQGQCGSCWIFSAVEQIESDYIRLNGQSNSLLLSEQQVLDCLSGGTYDGCNGGNPSDVYNYVTSSTGLATEAAYSYTAVHSTCKASGKTLMDNIASWTPLSITEDALATYIQTTGPLSICLATGGWDYYTGGILSASTCGQR